MPANPMITFRATPQLIDRLKKVAASQGRTLSNLIKYIVSQYDSIKLNNNEENTKGENNGQS